MKNKEAQQNTKESFVQQRRRILSDESSFFVQEAYRTLRINIAFSLPGEGCKCVCVTSSNTRDGKSINTLNISIAFAKAGYRVLLIETDMRKPSLPRLLIEKGSPGLSNVLIGQCTVENATRRNIYENLDIILSGDVPPNPAELLGSGAMDKLLTNAKMQYDYIFIDTPPVGVVSDMCVLAKHLDGALFLVYQNRTEKEMVVDCIQQMDLAGIKLLGFIMNHADRGSGRYGYKYKYRYKYRYKYYKRDEYGYGYGSDGR